MKKIIEKLNKSPINYFSDLFIIMMVVTWILTTALVAVFAIYSTIALSDNTLWSNLVELVSVPLSAGGAIWMVKNAVQHAIANKNGKQADMDFPMVEGADITKEEEE